jgi:hypothetical protein
MGIFSKPKFRSIDYNGKMKKNFPNFCSWLYDAREYLKSELSISDDNIIEFRFPIMTFGNIMGYNYPGIENVNGEYFLSMNSVSRRGKKITGNKVQIFNDLSQEEYNEKIKDVTLYLMTHTDYIKITTGEM